MKNNINILEEKALKAKDRKALPDNVFGLPKDRKYPMPDEEHVRKAIQFFVYCPKEQKKELAKNINTMAKKFNMTLNISKDSPFYKYADKEILEESTIDILSEYSILKEEFSSIKDSDFGIKGSRSYPLANNMQVFNAIKYFNFCPVNDRPELARNINMKLMENSIRIKVDKSNPFYKYTNFKVVSEDGIKIPESKLPANMYVANDDTLEVIQLLQNYKIEDLYDFTSFENFLIGVINEKKGLSKINIITLINICADYKYEEFDQYKRQIKGETGFDYFTQIQFNIIKDIKSMIYYDIYENKSIYNHLSLFKEVITNKTYRIMKRYILELIEHINIMVFKQNEIDRNNLYLLKDMLIYIDDIENRRPDIRHIPDINMPMPNTERFLNTKKDLSLIQLYEMLIKANIDIGIVDSELNDAPSNDITIESLSKITEGIEISSDGDIKLSLNPKKSFMDEFAETHKLLINNYKNNNFEGMKLNLAFLFTMINFIEREYIYNKGKKIRPDKLKDAEKARMFAINDFKRYMSELQKHEPNFDFTTYYKDRGFDKVIINIKSDSIVGIKKLLQKILLS